MEKTTATPDRQSVPNTDSSSSSEALTLCLSPQCPWPCRHHYCYIREDERTVEFGNLSLLEPIRGTCTSCATVLRLRDSLRADGIAVDAVKFWIQLPDERVNEIRVYTLLDPYMDSPRIEFRRGQDCGPEWPLHEHGGTLCDTRSNSPEEDWLAGVVSTVRVCDTTHERCARSWSSRLPKRVLDIKNCMSSRLVKLSRTDNQEGAYIALSYWYVL